MGILDPTPFKLSNVFKFWPILGNIISNDQNNKTQIQLQEDAQQWNQEQSDNAWQRGLEQWNRENEYNSPEEQIRRLREAGINPALAYSNGVMNQAGTSPDVPVPAPARGAPTQAYQMDPLTFAQIENIEAQTRNINSQTTYQDYLNQVEEALAHSPLRSVTVVSPDGSEEVQISYGNARVEFARRELEAIGLENGITNSSFNQLLYDIAVLTGSDSYGLSRRDQVPSEQPGYARARAALIGSQDVQDVASKMANLSYEAAQAEKAGRAAYNKWLEEHKDDPIMKVLLPLQGFIQTLGIHLPSFGGNSQLQGHYGSNGQFISRTSRSWFFGHR